MTKKNYLALFDLDGTLFDTGDVNYYAYKDSLEPYHVYLDREYFVRECNGKHYTEFLPILMGNREHLEEVHKAKKINYSKNLYRSRENAHLFEYIVTQEDITKVKPDPQGYLMAMEHFGVTADRTVIFENSPSGIKAARATGASVMIIDHF